MADPETETQTKTDTPTKPEHTPMEDPDRHYQPERLCPDQSKDGSHRGRP